MVHGTNTTALTKDEAGKKKSSTATIKSTTTSTTTAATTNGRSTTPSTDQVGSVKKPIVVLVTSLGHLSLGSLLLFYFIYLFIHLFL